MAFQNTGVPQSASPGKVMPPGLAAILARTGGQLPTRHLPFGPGPIDGPPGMPRPGMAAAAPAPLPPPIANDGNGPGGPAMPGNPMPMGPGGGGFMIPQGALPFYPPSLMQGMGSYNPFQLMGQPGGAASMAQLLQMAQAMSPKPAPSMGFGGNSPWQGRSGGDRAGQIGNEANRPGMSFRDWAGGLLGAFGMDFRDTAPATGGGSKGGTRGGGSDAEREARAESGRNQRGV